MFPVVYVTAVPDKALMVPVVELNVVIVPTPELICPLNVDAVTIPEKLALVPSISNKVETPTTFKF